MMFRESVNIRPCLHHKVVIAALILFSQDLTSGGGVQAWSYSYSIGPNRRWLEARQWCQRHFTDMVAIRNQEESDFLNNLLPLHSKYYWIGIKKVAGMWTWVGTNEIVPKEAQNWAPEEPDDIPAQDCVEIYIKSQKNPAKWNNEKCRNRKGTVCYSASCRQNSCGAHADCVETIGNYTCKCHPGFGGPDCGEAIACKPLLDPEQGSHSCVDPYGSYRFNSSCHFFCELGFHSVGTPQLQCQASGRWTHPAPLCQAEKCPVLNYTDVSGGDMKCSHPVAPYSYNSTCEVRCDEGYELIGQRQIQCDHTGQWTANVSTCLVKKCPRVFFPSTGNMTCVDSVEPFSYGSWCNFTCQEGFYLIGDDTITCLASGQWSKPTPTCTVAQCSSLHVLPHASMQCLDPLGVYSYSSVCTTQCEDGFNLIGSNTTECSSQGKWSHALPVCQAKRCHPINRTPHGSLKCFDPNGSFSFGSACVSTCEEGFLLNGTAETECTSLGVWSNDIPLCLGKRCPSLNSPPHGSLVCSDLHGAFSFSSRCRTVCDEGFIPVRIDETDCTSSGTWSREIPGCLARSCPLLDKAPQHGSMNCSHPYSPFSYGSRCHFECSDGFGLRGTPTLTCNSFGRWSEDLPTCLSKKCPTPSSPAHGFLLCSHPNGAFSYGSRCTSTCEEGFFLNGTADTECTSLGMWSREIPHCLARSCPLLDKAPQHGSMNCSHPYTPFSYGSHCGMECNEGFRLEGTLNVMCNASGHWSQDLPTCQPVQCEAIQALSSSLSMNCSHPLGNFSFGSHCFFTCEGESSLIGKEVLSCSTTGFWNYSLPTCTAEAPAAAASTMLYAGIGVILVIVLLALIIVALLTMRAFKKTGNGIIQAAPSWGERENPAFEF